ncbi:MAG: class I SAM-dependent DNA methyltransferase [Nitrospinae bacterium]|nr:class I SAM-dependent DNA methyltransferase [Nitrospinota bacterium]
MNAVEIEQAISELAEQPFNPTEFPFAFLTAFGNKVTTIKKLKKGTSNSSDIPNGVLQRNNIHMVVCASGETTTTLRSLKASPATSKGKAKFILATDGVEFEAEEMASGATVACQYSDFPNHFGFFLPLAGITTVSKIKNNPIDIQATSRLNRLYVELLKTNEDWGSDSRRQEFNQFMMRLIFCFFAEDTNIFSDSNMFTNTVERMSDNRSGNTHEVIGELFRAMDTDDKDRVGAKLPRWADVFPYVNGGLFSGSNDVPKFSRIARSYLLHAGNLNWQEINPDIFGSMIQAVADDEERGELGMHYTSVPNILKVLNPLFLDSLREQLEEAGDNARKLLNLRKRIANIRVFDPACGSGNFLVIAYIQMREIESEIIRRRNDDQKSWIKLDKFFGIELKNFAVEVARLSLLIAEFQCDVRFLGKIEARSLLLHLKDTGRIQQGNALRLDWLEICPSNSTCETYICGNPPYKGSTWRTSEQTEDLNIAANGLIKKWKALDYVSGWFIKSSEYCKKSRSECAFVATSSICQGVQASLLWEYILSNSIEITFAYAPFKWANLASHNAGVTVVIVGIKDSEEISQKPKLFVVDRNNEPMVKNVTNINPYLIEGPNVIIQPSSAPLNKLKEMGFGNMPNEGGFLLLSQSEVTDAVEKNSVNPTYIKKFFGSQEFIKGQQRYCIWVKEHEYKDANNNEWLRQRFESVREKRSESKRATTKQLSDVPWRFGEVRQSGNENVIVTPAISSENREYLPCGLLTSGSIVSNKCYALYNGDLWNIALIVSRLHWVWIGTVCGRLEMRISYSNTLGWNTFPVPTLTEKNKEDLTQCAENILLAREAHFPATIADLYNPEKMPDNLRQAHERNDEVLERIYIGRRFKNDTERLEKLFDLYTKMTTDPSSSQKATKKKPRKKASL